MHYQVPPHNGQPVDEVTRRAFLKAARRYLGVPWHHLGRSIRGVDCAGLVSVVVKEILGIGPDAWDYPVWPNPQLMRDICNRSLLPINRRDISPGDVALLYAPGVGVVHMGWYAGNTLIHANNEAHARQVVEITIHPGWNLRGAYTVPRFGEVS